MSSHNLEYHLQVLYVLEKKLGGRSGDLDKKSKGGADDFFLIKDSVMSDIHRIRETQKDRYKKMTRNEGKEDPTSIALKTQLFDLFKSTKENIERMSEIYQKQMKRANKHTPTEMQQKKVALEKITEVFESLKENDADGLAKPTSKAKTLTELRSEAIMKGTVSGRDAYVDKGPTQEEEEAILRWQQKNQEIDMELAKVNDGLDIWKQKMLEINMGIENTAALVDDVDKEVSKTTKMVQTSNKKLKEILHKYRAPSRFCWDIILIIFIIGLIGIVINMVI